VIRSGAVLDLQSVPLWALWVFVGLGGGFFAAVLFWMMPPALRRGEGTVSVAVGIGLFLLIGLAASRAVLWLGAVGFTVAALPLLWMGRLPPDMPSARDPASRQHPPYRQTARRGRFAGLAIVVLEVCVIVLSDVYVRGV
jgi:hypothetical protein